MKEYKSVYGLSKINQLAKQGWTVKACWRANWFTNSIQACMERTPPPVTTTITPKG